PDDVEEQPASAPGADVDPAAQRKPLVIKPRGRPRDPLPMGGNAPHAEAALPDMPDMPEASPPAATAGEHLFQIITDHVDPDAWMNFGGDRAKVSEMDGILMVTAAPSVHRRFREALSTLRAAIDVNLAIDAAIVDVE